MKPQIDIGNGDADDPGAAANAIIGASSADTNVNLVDISGPGDDRVDINFQTDNPLYSGSDIVIKTNNSDVQFDTGASTSKSIGTADNTFDAAVTNDDGPNQGSASVDSITVNQNEIVLSVSGQSDFDSGDTLSLNEIPFSVNSAPDDETKFGLVVETEPSSGTTVTTTSEDSDPESDYFGLESPDINFNGNSNVTQDVDKDGENGAVVQDGTGTDALLITSDNLGEQIAPASDIVVDLESNTGVTFDTSAEITENSDANNDDKIDIQLSGNTDDGISSTSFSADGETLTISLDSDDAVGSGETVEIDELFFNYTSSASNTELTVTTTTVSGNDVLTTDNKIIKPSSVDPANLFADANTDEDFGTGSGPGSEYGQEGSDEATDNTNGADNPTVDETITSSIFVDDGGSAFGGANVDLEIIEQPDGSEGASFNTTTLTTNSNGVADYEFTVGDTTGTYVVNASTDSGSVNVTYEAEPGEAADVTVTPIENAIVGGSGDLDQAALYVNATDANGNPVTATPTVDVTADNVGVSEIGAYEDKDPDGSRDSLTDGDAPDDTLDDGSFTIDDTNTDGSSVIEINSDQAEDVIVTVSYQGNSDSGTVTFYDQVGQIDLALNQSTVTVGDTVSAEATISESDGTTIEVPGVTIDYDDNTNGNTTFAGGADADSAATNDSGVASVTVTAEQNGTSTIDARTNLRADSATLTIDEQADTGSPLGGTAGEYDADGDGQVTASELGDAVTAFGQS